MFLKAGAIVTFFQIRRSVQLLELLLEQTLLMEMFTWLSTSITLLFICGGMYYLKVFKTENDPHDPLIWISDRNATRMNAN